MSLSQLNGKTYLIRTFGCQMNMHDSERVSGLLDSCGCMEVATPEEADIVVFMTCCVREAADTRLYGQCLSCKSLPAPPSGKRVIAVGGCIAQRDGEGLLTNLDNVDVVFGTHSIAYVGDLIAQAFDDGNHHVRCEEHEENPALGYRAIRICLTRPEIFKTQLRALYRASAYGQIAIMFPMIISVKEVKQIKAIIEEVKEELREVQIPFREDVELGIMIETPAAVMMSRELAKEVDFFSVGTNDLTQYTLAIDRQNQKLDAFYDPHHPAVLAMIRMAAENAHAEGKWIGICGELGADLELTEEFLAMGLDELSVSPAMVLPLRKKIRESK